MSTRALWKVLEAAFDHPNADGDVCRAAREELEAIEKAAVFLASTPTEGVSITVIQQAATTALLLEAIAEQVEARQKT